MFDYSWQKVLLWGSFVFFLGALLLRQEAGINQDLGRHLRLGEMIVAGGEDRRCALFTNCLTYSYPDYPFVNHHWGSEVIFYFIYKLDGFGGLILFKAIILGTAFLITVRHASAVRNTQNTQKAGMSENQRARVSDSPTLRFSDISGSPSFPSVLKLSIAVILTFLSINMMADRLTTRPEIFGYLLFSLLFWILDKKDLSNWRNLPNWMVIPIIMTLWANLHISFVFGVILVWIWAGCQVLTSLRGSPDNRRDDRGNPQDRHAPLRQGFAGLAMTMGVPAVSTLVTLLNPAGLRGAVMPISIMKDYGYTIVENMTPFFLRAFKPQPEYWIYAAILIITTIIFITSNKKSSGFSILSFYLFSIFPLIAVRHLAFFGLVTPVVLTPLIRSLLAKQGDSWSISGKFAKLSILAAGSLLVAALTNPVPLAYAKLPTVGLSADRRHEEAVKFVKQHDLQGKMWNNYDIGSYLEWSLPEHPTFVDGRPEAFPAGFFQETYIPMQESRQKWDETATKYDIQWVFAALTDATPWFGKWRAMIGNHEEWKIVYIDKSTVILVRPKQTD